MTPEELAACREAINNADHDWPIGTHDHAKSMFAAALVYARKEQAARPVAKPASDERVIELWRKACNATDIPPHFRNVVLRFAADLEAYKQRAVNEALDLLDILFSAYEDGLPCEEVDGGYIGNAVDLDEETFDKIADLLNRERPRVLKEKL